MPPDLSCTDAPTGASEDARRLAHDPVAYLRSLGDTVACEVGRVASELDRQRAEARNADEGDLSTLWHAAEEVRSFWGSEHDPGLGVALDHLASVLDELRGRVAAPASGARVTQADIDRGHELADEHGWDDAAEPAEQTPRVRMGGHDAARLRDWLWEQRGTDRAARVRDQLWLCGVLTEQRRRTVTAERGGFDDRADRVLTLLDPDPTPEEARDGG